MLIIRLQRIGRRNDPSFRVVLVEHTFRPQGKYIEDLGAYNPKSKQKTFDKERILYWISKGAQLSPTMHNMLVDEKIIDKAKIKAWKPKKRAEAEKPLEKPIEKPLEVPLAGQTEQGVVEGVPSEGKTEEVDTQPKKE